MCLDEGHWTAIGESPTRIHTRVCIRMTRYLTGF